MESTFFSKNDLADHKSFPRDIRCLAQLPSETLAALPRHVLTAFQAPTNAETDTVYSEAAEALAQPRAVLDHALDVAQFLLRELAPKGEAASDTPESLVSDIRDTFEVPEAAQEGLTTFLRELKDMAQRDVRLILLKRAHITSGLPVLNAVATKVDLRAVFSEEYKYHEDVAQFSPELVGTVPVGIVELTIHGGETEKVLLQLNRRTLQILQDHLAALQKQISIVERATQTLED